MDPAEGVDQRAGQRASRAPADPGRAAWRPGRAAGRQHDRDGRHAPSPSSRSGRPRVAPGRRPSPATVAPASTPVTVGQLDERIGGGHHRQLVGLLSDQGPDPPGARAVEATGPSGRNGSCRRVGAPTVPPPWPATVNRSSTEWPAIRRTAGRTKSSKLTMAETGLPGRPKTGVAGRLEEAEGERLGRPDGDLHPAHGAPAPLAQHGLDHVGIADADPAAGEHGVAPCTGAVEDGPQRPPSSSPTIPRSTGSHPSCRTRARREWRLASRIFPGRSGTPDSTSSSPVESTPTRGRGWTTTSATPWLARLPRWAGVSTVPTAATVSPTATSWPTVAHERAGGRGPVDHDHRAVGRRGTALSSMHTASAPGGQGRTGHDPGGLTGPDHRGPAPTRPGWCRRPRGAPGPTGSGAEGPPTGWRTRPSTN